MSYYRVLQHIEQVLNSCGDTVNLIPTGNTVPSTQSIGSLSIEIEEVYILKQNNCFSISCPNPTSNENSDTKWKINRIRVSETMIDDYAKNYPFTNQDMLTFISGKSDLFAYYN